jgi:hypothetical protein
MAKVRPDFIKPSDELRGLTQVVPLTEAGAPENILYTRSRSARFFLSNDTIP